jgi:hypothetical protein
MDEFLIDNGINIIKRSTIDNYRNPIPNNKLTILFKESNGKFINVELLYNFKSIFETNKEKVIDNKIGTIDFETVTKMVDNLLELVDGMLTVKLKFII